MQTIDEFIARLPGRDSPYCIDKLSQAETTSLEEALLDGYGDVFAFDSKSLPLPAVLTKGLLRHPFFMKSTSEVGKEDYERKFWAVLKAIGVLSACFPCASLRRACGTILQISWIAFAST
jgi:hypothetical protein